MSLRIYQYLCIKREIYLHHPLTQQTTKTVKDIRDLLKDKHRYLAEIFYLETKGTNLEEIKSENDLPNGQ